MDADKTYAEQLLDSAVNGPYYRIFFTLWEVGVWLIGTEKCGLVQNGGNALTHIRGCV